MVRLVLAKEPLTQVFLKLQPDNHLVLSIKDFQNLLVPNATVETVRMF
jgi:hypothetical protein